MSRRSSRSTPTAASSRRKQASRTAIRLRIEPLEPRELLSVNPMGYDHPEAGTLRDSSPAVKSLDESLSELELGDSQHNPHVIAENVIVGQTVTVQARTVRGDLLDAPPQEPESDHNDNCPTCGNHGSNLRMDDLPIDGPAIDSPAAPRSGRGTPRTIDPADPLPPISTAGASTDPFSSDPKDPGSSGGPDGDFVLFRNAQLPDNGAAFQASDTGEPSIGTYRNTVFQTGNWYASVSGDNGASYRYINPFTMFPTTGPFSGGFCCDQRVAQNPSRGLTIWYLQYLRTAMNTTGTNGVRIAVANGTENLLDNAWTYYDFSPASFGLPAQDRWMDFPNMEVTNNFVYMTSNVFDIAGTNVGSVMWRMSLTDLAAGVPTTPTFWNTTGVIALANGATTTMFGGTTTGTNSVRMYRQNESDGNLSSVNITGLFSSYTGTHVTQSPDGNNWTGFSDERMQTVWVSGNEVGMMWNSAQGGNRPQPFVRTIRINHTNNGVINEPDVWDANFAIHYPDMAVNARGHVSGVMWDGNSTNAPGLIAAIDDDLNGDPFTEGWETWDIYRGTNAGAGRWGDYTGAVSDDVFGNTWLGGGYVLQGPAGTAGNDNDNNDVRAVWWGRSRDNPQILPAYSDVGDTIGTHGPLLTAPGSFTTYNAIWNPTSNRADVDLFSVLGYAGSTLTASTFLPTAGSTDMDTMLRIFNDQGVEVAFDDDAGPGLYSSVTFTFVTSGFYYVGVSGFNNRNYSPFTTNSGIPGRTGDYGLTVNLTPPPDPGDTIATSVISNIDPGNFGFLYYDRIGNGPWGGLDVDMYSFNAVWGENLVAQTHYFLADADTYMRLFNSAGQQIAADDDSGSFNYSQLILPAPYTGTYYVGISGWPNVSYNPFIAGSGLSNAIDPGEYEMFLDLDATSDAGDTLGSSLFLLSGIGSYGLYGSVGNYPYLSRDVDLYSFNGTLGQRMTAYTDFAVAGTTSMDTVLRVFDQFGNQLLVDDDSGPGTYSALNDYALPYSGTYYVGVSGFPNFSYDPTVGGSGSAAATGDYLFHLDIAGPAGDFDGDQDLDLADIDALVAEIAARTHHPAFDLTGDGLVNLLDRDAWLAAAGEINLGPGRAYQLADANLDSVVDGSDFGIWNANKFTAVAAWSRGDFSADGAVDGSDFGIWNVNKFTSSNPALVVTMVGLPLPSETATRLETGHAKFVDCVWAESGTESKRVPGTLYDIGRFLPNTLGMITVHENRGAGRQLAAGDSSYRMRESIFRRLDDVLEEGRSSVDGSRPLSAA